MAFSVSPELSRKRAAAGRTGARRRWGEPRVVRLDELTTEQRRLVLALVEAAKASPSTTEAA